MAKEAVDNSTKELNLDDEWDLYEETRKRINALIIKIDEIVRLRQYLINEMAELKKQGINYAGTTYKDGKYLYLVYPSKDGEPRRREYIGQDEDKIKAALEDLERGIKYDKKEREKKQLESKLHGILYSLKFM